MSRRRRKKYPRRRRFGSDDYEPMGLDLAPETKRGIAIVTFSVAGIVAGLGILGLAGDFGQLINKLLRLIFGSAAFVAPVFFFGIALSLFFGVRTARYADSEDEDESPPLSTMRTYLGSTLFILSVTGMLHLFALNSGTDTAFELVQDGRGGGYLGVFTSFPLYTLMGFSAALVIMTALAIVSFLVAFDVSLHGIFRVVAGFFKNGLPVPTPGHDATSSARSNIPPVTPDPPIKINTMENSGFSKSRVPAGQPQTLGFERSRENVEPAAADGTVEAPLLHATPSRFARGEWKLPPTDLLNETQNSVESGNIEATVTIIKKTLEDFGIIVDMGEVNVGPTVTQYTFRPAVGVKLSQIVSLQDDLALALAAPSIRIEAPIPGKSLVGVEVPNRATTLVGLRELVESDSFKSHPSRLAFVLGRDVAGKPEITDLEDMPHLLVAGSTGAGKTVCLNTILTSLLYRNSPQELRFIIIDPKQVDLTLYSGIPHLLAPVVTDYKRAVNALKWTVAEMDRRYTTLSQSSKRNIQEYNQSNKELMPYIVIVVDELAHLMSMAKNDVETTIVRLAQMARAVGIHLILATQRPSVDVITGLIKANLPTRIAFRVTSQVDSRTILDIAGAENLLGKGDMLFAAANLPVPKRIQSAFIGARELNGVLDFIKAESGPVDYQEEILEKPQRGSVGGGGSQGEGEGEDEDDEVISAAIEEIRRARKASASLLQRRLSLGYARAARVLDVLEKRGLIGPSDGAKPREIYLDNDSGEAPPTVGEV